MVDHWNNDTFAPAGGDAAHKESDLRESRETLRLVVSEVQFVPPPGSARAHALRTGRDQGLSEDRFDDLAVDVGQPKVAPLKTIR